MVEKKTKEKVVINAEDCKNMVDFFKHFNIPMASRLTRALAAFEKVPSEATQKEFKFAFCYAFVNTSHPALEDEIFKGIRDKCRDFVKENK